MDEQLGRALINCVRCGRELYIPIISRTKAEADAQIERARKRALCPRCATDAKEGKQFPSEAK